MTGKEIKEDALLYGAVGGYNIPDPTVVNYINRAVELIARDYDEVGVKSTEEYVIDNTNISTWIDLPSDFLVVKRIYYKKTPSTLAYTTYEPNDYLIENGQIRFDTASTYVMEYVPVPTAITNIEQEPSIPTVYHAGISYYVAYRIKAEIFGDEENDKERFFAMFNDYTKKAFARINRRKRRRKVKAPQWG